MRILALGINYWPDETGIAPYNTIRCEYLAARGHEVSALTGFPYYPQWYIPDEYRRRVYFRERRNGVTLIRSWLYVPRGVTSFKRMVHEASFSLSALLAGGARPRPDVILAVSPPLPLMLSARLLGKLYRVPYIIHVEDLQPDAAVDLGMIASQRLARALYALERMAYRAAAAISTLNEAMADRIRAKGIAREKVSVVPHGVDPDLFQLRETACPARFRRAHGFEGRFLVVHGGNMGVKQGLDVILDAAVMSRDSPEIIYLLVGDGAARKSLQGRVEEQKLSNVRLLPPLPRREFRDLLAAADLALVTQRRAVADILFPSKVETLMAAGRPILASLNAQSAVARVLRQSGAGEVVEPERPHALLSAILALRHQQTRMAAMGQRGQAYAREHWERGPGLELMESTLRRVCLEAKETVTPHVTAADVPARAVPDAD